MANRAYCIALKPCQLAGQKFLIGERVPGDLLDEKSASRMRQMGYLSKYVSEAEVEPGDNPPPETVPKQPTKPKK